jgi:hypothetical protein
MNIELLKAQVAAQVEANTARVKEAAEVARLEAKLKLETSEDLFQARVKLEASAYVTRKLESLVQECEALVASMPVHNPKTRENRKWAGSHRYAYGSQVDLAYNLATGILYACQEHKQLLLAHTGLNMQLLQEIVEAFGSPAYYSRMNNSIVDERPADIYRLHNALAVLQSDLGVSIDTKALNEQAVTLEFLRAQNNAYSQLQQAQEAIAEADFTM